MAATIDWNTVYNRPSEPAIILHPTLYGVMVECVACGDLGKPFGLRADAAAAGQRHLRRQHNA